MADAQCPWCSEKIEGEGEFILSHAEGVIDCPHCFRRSSVMHECRPDTFGDDDEEEFGCVELLTRHQPVVSGTP
jgi:DNA-directed RNA polymerase subunit RPC12/RpoP